MRVPFVVYADFECLTTKINKFCGKGTKQYQHNPSGFCYHTVCHDKNITQQHPDLFKPTVYSRTSENDDVGQIFFDMLQAHLIKVYDRFKGAKEMVFTAEVQNKYNMASKCHICSRCLVDKEGRPDKVRDHDHLTGKYQGAVHNVCNLKFQTPSFNPVLFHNLSGYDAHLFIKNLGVEEGDIKCIPKTEEKYISFSKYIYINKIRLNKGKLTEKRI